MVKTFPCRPSRCCLNSTGPGEEILTASAVIRSRGERIIKAISERSVSINRFQNLLYTAFRSYQLRRSSVQSGGISVHPANRYVPPEKRWDYTIFIPELYYIWIKNAMPDTCKKVEWFFCEAHHFSLSDHFPVAHAQSMWYNVIQQIKCTICFK